jgi:hypothetical protein
MFGLDKVWFGERTGSLDWFGLNKVWLGVLESLQYYLSPWYLDLTRENI